MDDIAELFRKTILERPPLPEGVKPVIIISKIHDEGESTMDDKPHWCECCEFEGMPVKEYRTCGMSASGGNPMTLCMLCASTYASNRIEYRRPTTTDEIIGAICYVGNTILKKLDEIKDKE